SNKACAGVGIAVSFGSPLIEHNVISDNTQAGCSGGIGGGIDVTSVDLATVRFGPAGAGPVRAHFRDLNGDGRPDVVLQFRMHSTGITCGAADVVLSGKTQSGRTNQGSDSVRTVGCQ